MVAQKVVVRIYLTESRARLKRLLQLLRASGKIRGATAFRGIAGFGTTSPADEDASEPKDPPVVLEFFDTRANVEETIRFVRTLVAPRHVVAWPVEDMLGPDAPLGAPKPRA
jgi:PII-like signaling protein